MERYERDSYTSFNHQFPTLSEAGDRRRDNLFNEKDNLIQKYKDILTEIGEMLRQEEEIYKELDEVNSAICGMEGHRLSETLYTGAQFDEHGEAFTERTHYRICLVCGKWIYKEDINAKDVVVKGEISPEFDLRKRLKKRFM